MTTSVSTAPRATISVVGAATLVMLMVYTAPLAAIGAVGASLDAGVDGRAWILSSMSIGLAATLLPAGAIADDAGRRRALMWGLALTAVACAVCVVATDPATFVGARVVQGVGGALITAAGLGIVAHTFPLGPARATAAGIWGASVGAGIAFGPILAAATVEWASWRLDYALLALLAAAVAGIAPKAVSESRSHQPRGIDVTGMGLLGAAITCLLAALVFGRQGWSDSEVVVLGGAGVMLAVAFFVHEARTAEPMLDPALWRAPAFRAATVAAFVVGTGPIALFSYFNGFAEAALGYTPMHDALLLLMWSATSVVFALLARRLPPAFSARWQFTVGLLVLAGALITLVGIDPDSTWLRFAPGLLLAGIASGVLNSALGREAVASVPEGRGAMGSGANNTSRYLGAAVGVTVVAVVVAGAGTTPEDLLRGWDLAAVICSGTCLVGAFVTAWSRPRRATVGN